MIQPLHPGPHPRNRSGWGRSSLNLDPPRKNNIFQLSVFYPGAIMQQASILEPHLLNVYCVFPILLQKPHFPLGRRHFTQGPPNHLLVFLKHPIVRRRRQLCCPIFSFPTACMPLARRSPCYRRHMPLTSDYEALPTWAPPSTH